MSQTTEPPPAAAPPAWRSRFGRSGMAVLVVLVGVLVAAALHLAKGPFPWGVEVARRVSEHLALRPREYAIIGLWWGCLYAVIVSAALIVLSRLWLPGGSLKPRRAPHFPANPPLAWHVGLLVVLLAAGILRAPRLGQSLWNDEEYAMRRFAHGEWHEDAKTGRWVFDPVTWEDTLFECRNANNHHLNSVATRWALDVWRFVKGEPREAFSEAALRTPAFAAGILMLILIAILGVEAGAPWIGLGAAALLALHPWHIRYSTEAKGYAFMLFFFTIAVLALVRAFRTNKAATWCWFAIGQAGCLLSFAGSLHLILGLNLLAALECLIRREPRRLGTLIGFGLLASLPVTIWMLPSVPQIIGYTQREDILREAMGWNWWRDVLSHLMAGIPFTNPSPQEHLGTSWQIEAEGGAAFRLIAGGLLPLTIVAGLLFTPCRNTAARLTLLAPMIGAGLAFTQASLQGTTMMVWYLVYLLVPVTFAAAGGMAVLLPARSRTTVPGMILLAALYAVATLHARECIRSVPRQPMREAVASIRDRAPEALTAVFGVSDRQTKSYDPRVRVLETPADLDTVIAEARESRRPFYVYFCGRTESQRRNPDLMKRILDEKAFRHVLDEPGLEAMFSYHVYQWRVTPVTSEEPGGSTASPHPEKPPSENSAQPRAASAS